MSYETYKYRVHEISMEWKEAKINNTVFFYDKNTYSYKCDLAEAILERHFDYSQEELKLGRFYYTVEIEGVGIFKVELEHTLNYYVSKLDDNFLV